MFDGSPKAGNSRKTVGKKPGYKLRQTGMPKNKLELMRTKWDPSLFFTSSKPDAVDDPQKNRFPFPTQLHVHLAHDSEKLKEEIQGGAVGPTTYYLTPMR